MSDPYFYITFMFIFNAISLPLYLIFMENTVSGKLVRTLLTGIFMVWQAYIYLSRV